MSRFCFSDRRRKNLKATILLLSCQFLLLAARGPHKTCISATVQLHQRSEFVIFQWKRQQQFISPSQLKAEIDLYKKHLRHYSAINANRTVIFSQILNRQLCMWRKEIPQPKYGHRIKRGLVNVTFDWVTAVVSYRIKSVFIKASGSVCVSLCYDRKLFGHKLLNAMALTQDI